jgi:hypothetical protein
LGDEKHNIFVAKPERKRPLGRPGRVMKIILKCILRK